MASKTKEKIFNKDCSIEIHLCAYNNENVIADCIKSFKHQINKDIKLAFLNDGSTDNTLSVFKESMRDIPSEFYRVINLDKNHGLTYGKNLLINSSQAKFVASMDSDDICLPNRFKIQYEYLNKNPNVDVLGGLAINFENNEQIERINLKIRNKKNISKFLKNKPITHEKIIKNLWRNPIIHPTVCIRRNKLISAGAYNINFKTSQDYELWPRLYLNGLIFNNLNIPLIFYRKSNPKKYKPLAYLITFYIALSYYKKVIGFNTLTIFIVFSRCIYKTFFSFFKRLSINFS